MLVIMKYRNIYLFLQLALNFKAARSRDILQVNASERRRDILSDIYNLIYILSFQTDREGVDPGEFLKQQGFSVHNRNGRQTSDIAQSEHCGSVADDCHGIALIGIFIDVFRVFVDFPARFRYSPAYRPWTNHPCLSLSPCWRLPSSPCVLRAFSATLYNKSMVTHLFFPGTLQSYNFVEYFFVFVGQLGVSDIVSVAEELNRSPG